MLDLFLKGTNMSKIPKFPIFRAVYLSSPRVRLLILSSFLASLGMFQKDHMNLSMSLLEMDDVVSRVIM